MKIKADNKKFSQKEIKETNKKIEHDMESNQKENESIVCPKIKSKNSSNKSNIVINGEPDDGYLTGIRLIEKLISKISSDNKIYLFFSKFENEKIIFTIYECDKIWSKSFTKKDFEVFKENMGLQGDWRLFFDSLEKAIRKRSGGDLSLKITHEKKQKLILNLFHPIGENLKVKSEVIFENYIGEENLEFNKLCFNLCVDSIVYFETKNESKSVSSTFENPTSFNLKPPSVSDEEFMNYEKHRNASKLSTKIEIKKASKRNFRSNLINPNLKKRNIKGNKFVNVSDSSGEENVDEEY